MGKSGRNMEVSSENRRSLGDFPALMTPEGKLISPATQLLRLEQVVEQLDVTTIAGDLSFLGI